MGCDIHMFIERRLDNSHKWELDPGNALEIDEDEPSFRFYKSVTATGRWYGLFFAMAGVRGGDQQLFEPRGVPEDASSEGAEAMNQYGGDGHSHSWLTLEEMAECLTACGMDLRKKVKPEAFFDYSKYKYNDPERPVDWASMYHYALKWIEDTKKSESDIVPHLRSDPEVRFLFFFDN